METLTLSKRKQNAEEARKIVESIISEHLNQFEKAVPTLEELATKYGWSVGKLKNVFKVHTGMAYYQYYQHLRMQKGRLWLKSGLFSVGEISKMLGFIHPTKFIIQFKKHFGTTPLKYSKLPSK